MGMRDLVMGRSSCAVPGSSSSSSSSSSSNPLSTDAFISYSPKSELSKGLSASAVSLKASFDLFQAVPLSTVPGDEDEVLDQGSHEVEHRQGTNFVNGHHGDTCENSQTSILYAPGLKGIEPHLRELDEIDSTTSMTFKPKFDGPPEIDVPDLFRPSSFQSYKVLGDQSGEHLQGLVNRYIDSIDASYDIEMRCPRMIPHPQMDEFWNQPPATLYELQNCSTEVLPHSFEQQDGANSWVTEFEQGIDQRAVSDDGGWLSFLGIALIHLGSLSQPRFWDEPVKWHEQVIGHRAWIEMDGLQQRSGWSVKVEATRESLFDALQDAAMLAVITMRLHFPVEFRGTPFMVLPMVPGQRSRLDYPVIGCGATAATFMGISYDDVATLQRERFASFHRERWESCESLELEEHMLRRGLTLALARKIMEELPSTPESNRMVAEMLENSGAKEADSIPRDCGWSVLVSDKVQQQVEPSHGEEIPPTTASSSVVPARDRL